MNGDADSISVNDNANLTVSTGFTISVWAYMDDATNFIIMSKGQYDTNNAEYLFYFQGTDRIVINVFTDVNNFIGRYYNTALTGDQGAWHHYVATWDGTTSSNGLDIYRDGVAIDDSDDNNPTFTGMPNTATSLYLGYTALGGAKYANGKISEVATWNDNLTTTQILQLYNSHVKGMPTQILPGNLVLYLPLDDRPEETGINADTYRDLSNTGNTGTGVDADGDSVNVGETVLSYPPKVGNWE